MTDGEFADFVEYLADKDITYSTSSERKLEELREVAQEESYYAAIEGTLQELQDKITHDKRNDIQKNRAEITRILELEIVSRYEFDKGRIANSLKDDPDVLEALKTLKNAPAYRDILTAG